MADDNRTQQFTSTYGADGSQARKDLAETAKAAEQMGEAVGKATDKVAKGAKGASMGLAELNKQAQAAREGQAKVARESADKYFDRLSQRLDEAARAQARYQRELDKYNNINWAGNAEKQAKALEMIEKQLNPLSASQGKYASETQRLLSTWDTASQMSKKYAADLQILKDRLASGAISADQFARAQENINRAQKQLGTGGNQYSQTLQMQSALTNTFQSIAAGQPILNTLFIQATQAVGAIGGLSLGLLAVGTAGAVAAAAAYQVGKAIAYAGDEANTAIGRISMFTGSMESATYTFEKFQALGADTGIKASETSGIFTRFFVATRDINASEQRVIKFTETLQKLGVASRATTQELASGLRQLSQGLGSGVLQGDEFRSVRENLPLVAQVLADYFKVNIDQLRKMASEGKLTTDEVFAAIEAGADKANKLYAQVPVNIDRAWNQASVATDNFLVRLNEITGISEKYVNIIQAISGAINTWNIAIGGTATKGAIEDLQNQINAAREDVLKFDSVLSALSRRQAQRRVDRLTELRNRGQENAAGNLPEELRQNTAAYIADLDPTRAAQKQQGLLDKLDEIRGKTNDVVKAEQARIASIKALDQAYEQSQALNPLQGQGITPEKYAEALADIEAKYRKTLEDIERPAKRAAERAAEDAERQLARVAKIGEAQGEKIAAGLMAADQMLSGFAALQEGEGTRAAQKYWKEIDKLNKLLDENASKVQELQEKSSKAGATDGARAAALAEINKIEASRADILDRITGLEKAAIEVERERLEVLRQIDKEFMLQEKNLAREANLSKTAAGSPRGSLARVQAEADLERERSANRIAELEEEQYTRLLKMQKDGSVELAKLNDAQLKARAAAWAEYYKTIEESQKALELEMQAADIGGGLVDTLRSLESGDIVSVLGGLSAAWDGMDELSIKAGSASKAFDLLADDLLNSAQAGEVFGNLVGKLFGRSEQQNKNAQVGSKIGGAVAKQFGVPKFIGSFVGNVIGGVFGPGKSDATAGAQIYTASDRIQNFDTSVSKQDAGNMSARDALAESVNSFTNLLEKAAGARLSSIVALEIGSREGNRFRVTDAQGQIVRSGGTAVGDTEGVLSQVLAAIVDVMEGVDAGLKARLQAVDFSNLERAEADVNFVLEYQNALKELNGEFLNGQEEILDAANEVRTQTKYVKEFADQATRLGFSAEETNSALRIFVDRFAGISGLNEEFTETEIAVKVLQAQFAELPGLLKAVGYSAEEASLVLARTQETRMAELRAGIVEQQDRRYNELIGNGFVNAIADAIAEKEKEIRDAVAVGLGSASAERNFGAEIVGILTGGLTEAQIAEAVRLYGQIPGVADAAAIAMEKLRQAADGTAEAVRSAADILQERTGLEERLLQLQGNTAELQRRQLSALDASNRGLLEQIFALEAAAEAEAKLAEQRQKDAATNKALDERTVSLETRGRVDAEIRMLEFKQKAEMEAAKAAGYSVEQLQRLADVLQGEMNWAVADLAKSAADASRAVTLGLEERVLRLSQAEDVNIKILERQQNAEFAAAVAAGHSADQLKILADVLGIEMTRAVADLNRATEVTSEGLQVRLAQAKLKNPEFENQASALEAQIKQIQRNRELADATNENVRAMLRAIYAQEDQADAALKVAEAAQEAADGLERIRGFGQSIREFVDQVRGGSVEGYLSPQQQLANASTQFQRQLALSQAGDETALSGITGYAERYILAQQNFSGSGGNSQQVISGVLAALEALPATKSFDQKQLEILEQIRDDTILNPIKYGNEQDKLIAALQGLPEAATGAELSAALAPYFNMLDRSLDGLISFEEFKQGIGGLATDATARTWFAELDRNGDGMISRQEMTAQVTRDLGTGSGGGTLKAISDLLYAGNVDRLNIGNSVVHQLAALGHINADGNIRVSNLHTWQTQVWDVMQKSYQPGGFFDKIRHNTATTALMLGGSPSYAIGTGFHPGGSAKIHSNETLVMNMPRGTQVIPRPVEELMAETFAAANGNRRGGNSVDLQAAVAVLKEVKETQLNIAKALAKQQSQETTAVVGAVKEVSATIRAGQRMMG